MGGFVKNWAGIWAAGALTVAIGCSSGGQAGSDSTETLGQVAEDVHGDGHWSKDHHDDHGDKDHHDDHGDKDHHDRHHEEHRGHCAHGQCSVTLDDAGTTYAFSASHDGLDLEQTLVSAPKPWGLTNDVKIKLGSRVIWHWTSSLKEDGSFVTSVDYGKPLSGVGHVDVTSNDGKTAIAVVDGKQTSPFDLTKPSPIVFPNGKRAPDVRVPPGLAHQAKELLEIARREAPDCWKEQGTAAGVAPAAVSALAQIGGQADFGHLSFTHDSVECITCGVSCDVGFGTCIYGAATLGATCGPFAWICIPAGLAACGIAAVICAKKCFNDSCCPHECGGSNFDPSCCEESEACLSPQTNLCCSSGKAACGHGPGAQCCDAGDKCLADAPVGSKCCASNQEVCGNTCCDSLSTCVDASTGLCCLPSQACGSTCCGLGQVCDAGSCVAEPPPVCISCTMREDCFEAFGEHGRCDVDNCCKSVPF